MINVLLLVCLLVSNAVALRNSVRQHVISKARHMELHGRQRNNAATPAYKEDDSFNYFGTEHELPGSNDKKVSVMKFKDNIYVNIRKYAKDKSGEVVATKTGISLTIEQWEALKALAPLIDNDLLELRRRTSGIES